MLWQDGSEWIEMAIEENSKSVEQESLSAKFCRIRQVLEDDYQRVAVDRSFPVKVLASVLSDLLRATL